MPTFTTITVKDFLKGKIFHDLRKVTKHTYKAEWTGKGIIVRDDQGAIVKVSYGGTVDNRTVTASIDNVGFIGGWQYPHKAMPFRSLVASINMGILYRQMADLPTRATIYFITCPGDPEKYGPYRKAEAAKIADALTRATGRTYTAELFDPSKH